MRILIVDDELPCRRLMTLLLGPLGACDACSDGAEAVSAVEKAFAEGRPYGLICLDVQMGRMDGQEALRGIRAVELAHERVYGAGALVVMTTSFGDTRNVSRAFGGMCDGYIVKPVTSAKLSETLAELGVGRARAV